MPAPHGADEPINQLIARLRLERGWSQRRVADLLCVASGRSTITRHELSRWERGERIPTPHWLGWLCLVLEVPLPVLERAAAVSRRLREWPPAGSPDEHPDLAPTADGLSLRPGRRVGATAVAALAARLAELRRMDDLVGGADLYPLVRRELDRTTAFVREASCADPVGRQLRGLLAQLYQLTGWVAADAGRYPAAQRNYLTAVRVARDAGDEQLAASVLGSLSYLRCTLGDPGQARTLADAGYTRAGRHAAPAVRALLLQRSAWAAARAGDAHRCRSLLDAAAREYDRAHETPAWLYWLDRLEFDAMTGRCHAALHRPELAEPLLRPAVERYDPTRPRSAALYLSWLAEAQLDAGEIDLAAGSAVRATRLAVAAGSVRLTERVRELRHRFTPGPDTTGGRRFVQFFRTARRYLPVDAETALAS